MKVTSINLQLHVYINNGASYGENRNNIRIEPPIYILRPKCLTMKFVFLNMHHTHLRQKHFKYEFSHSINDVKD